MVHDKGHTVKVFVAASGAATWAGAGAGADPFVADESKKPLDGSKGCDVGIKGCDGIRGCDVGIRGCAGIKD